MSLTCGARSTVSVDQSTVHTGRVRTGPRQGWIWVGLARARGVLWRCHVIAMGLYWAVVYGSRFTVDLGVLVHAPQTGLRWTESTTLSSGIVYEHRVHARVAGEEESSISSLACSRR